MNRCQIFLNGCLGVAMAMTVGCSEKTAEKADRRPLVRVGTVTNLVPFADALAVQGTVRAKSTASIASRVPGTIDEMLVDEGATVSKGAPLFRIDQVNLGNAIRAAKDDLALAKAKLSQAEALDAKARLDLDRMVRLVREGAVTRDMFEKAEIGAKNCAAAIDAARATLAKAETGLSMAEKNFADSVARAPFDGIVTHKFKNTGDFCCAGVKVFELEDTSCYEICCSLNAEQYGRIRVGVTELEEDRRSLVVSYKSPSVNVLTRTFEIRAVVPKTDAMAAGMLLDCRVVFARRTSQAVPASAVAHRGGGDCVFKVTNGRVVRVPVVAGVSSGGLREIVSPVLSPEDRLIVEGMLLVNENDDVRIRE